MIEVFATWLVGSLRSLINFLVHLKFPINVLLVRVDRLVIDSTGNLIVLTKVNLDVRRVQCIGSAHFLGIFVQVLIQKLKLNAIEIIRNPFNQELLGYLFPNQGQFVMREPSEMINMLCSL